MTVAIKINENDGKTRNVMTGGETTVDFDFPIFDEDHIRVIETDTNGDITELVKDTDFTVPAGSVNQQAGGTVNLTAGSYPSGATAGHVFTALQDAPYSRTTDFTQAGNFFADTLNQELDLFVQQVQQINRDIARAALLPEDTTLTGVDFPTPVDELVLAWDGTSGAIQNGPSITDISNAGANATAAAASAAAAADYAAALSGTSTTSLTIGTGSKSFVTQADKQWSLGQRLRAASDDGTKVMEGEVTAYSGTSLTISVDYTEDSGTHADWNISLTGARGETGPSGSLADGDYGDVTVGGSGTTMTINANAVEPTMINLVGATDAAISAGDSILFADADGSNVVKRDAVQGILDLVTGVAGGVVGVQYFPASGTYTPTAGTNALIVISVGGGEGGQGSRNNAGTDGGDTTFGAHHTAGGGGVAGVGVGGTATGATIPLRGGSGGRGSSDGEATQSTYGGNGGASFFGGGGSGGTNSVNPTAGLARGSGGGSAGETNASATEGTLGGGAGATCIDYITSFGATETVTIGAGGAGGAAAGGIAGAAGEDGCCIVIELS